MLTHPFRRASAAASLTRRAKLLAALLALTGAGSTSAAVVTSFDDIQLWTGTGSNRAALVIDWNNGASVDTFVWGFRWDGVATGRDLLLAVAGAIGTDTTAATPDGSGDAALTLNTQFFGGFGNAVYQWTYATDNATYSRGGFDPDTSGYWAYYTADNTTTTPGAWTFSEVGMDARVLSNNAWDAWTWAPEFIGSAPGPAVAAVPEPTAALLLVVGAGFLLVAARRRAHA